MKITDYAQLTLANHHLDSLRKLLSDVQRITGHRTYDLARMLRELDDVLCDARCSIDRAPYRAPEVHPQDSAPGGGRLER